MSENKTPNSTVTFGHEDGMTIIVADMADGAVKFTATNDQMVEEVLGWVEGLPFEEATNVWFELKRRLDRKTSE